jgi:hypothetical protein
MLARSNSLSQAVRPRRDIMAQFLVGLELPDHLFHGADPHLVVVAAAGMLQASPGAGAVRRVGQERP